MSTTKSDPNDGDMLSSSEMAGLIADALIVGGSIGKSSYAMAEAKATEIIDCKDSPDCRGRARPSSRELAELIVDALLMAGLVSRSALEKARAIVSEEIDARKGIGDYL